MAPVQRLSFFCHTPAVRQNPHMLQKDQQKKDWQKAKHRSTGKSASVVSTKHRQKNKCNEICHEVLACFKVSIAEAVAEPTAATLSQGVAGAVAEPVAEPAIACVHMCSAVACVGSSKLPAAVAAFDPKECFVGFAYKLREAKHFDCFKRRLQAMDDLRALLPRPNLESSWCLTT